MPEKPESVFNILTKTGCIESGNFVLKSGEKSDIYINIRLLASNPSGLREIIKKLESLTSRVDYDLIVGVPNGGTMIASPFAYQVEKPLLPIVKIEDDYIIPEWADIRGLKILLFDDVVSFGTSLRPVVKFLTDKGAIINLITVVLDRREKPHEYFEEIPISYLLRLHKNFKQQLQNVEK